MPRTGSVSDSRLSDSEIAQLLRGCRPDLRPKWAGIPTEIRDGGNGRWRARACLFDHSAKRGANSGPNLSEIWRRTSDGQRTKARESRDEKAETGEAEGDC